MVLSHHSKAIFEQFVPQVGVTPMTELLSALFGEVAALFNVERVGYSRMEMDRSAIQQEVQFHLTGRKCDTSGLPKLFAKDYPGYFAALETPPGVVVSHDVMRDERLKEFWEGYFTPLKITSMLDVPVHRAGQLYGVICHEHTGPQRRWTDDEVAAACSFAHLVALAVETDQRQKAEAKLSAALEREKEMVQMKTSFVSLVSHEFRTPLGVIVSSADILEHYFDRLRPGQRAGHLQDIRQSAQQMSRLMEEVLLLGKVESGKMACRHDPLDLAEFCQRITDEQHSATSRKCPIQLDLAGVDGADGSAHGDESLLQHILGNLIGNAVKYSPAGRPVKFRVRRAGTAAEFVITDEGIGIEPGDQKHLFTAFYRGSNVGHIPGTGLGLVIVKRCVDLHGGTLTVASRPDLGSTFTVRLDLFATSQPGANKARPVARKKTRVSQP
jgi:signal transduction histidine kinase